MSTIGVEKRRKPVWVESDEPFDCCPECGSDLVRENHTFLTGGHTGGELQTLMISNEADFCKKCSVVVLNKLTFDSLLSDVMGIDDYKVAGIVDLDAIPEDEQDLPIGSGDTPMKLMEFIKSSPKKSSKVERNAPCPCGSGKKYKKCCALVEA